MEDEMLIVEQAATFDTIYRRGFAPVYRLAWALAGPDVAEEIAQEAFLKAHRNWAEVGQLDDPVGWVKKVARNLAVDRVRRLGAEARALVRVGQPPHVVMSDSTLGVWDAVRRLPRRQREAVVLMYVEGLTRAEIAAAMGVSTETVKTHLDRARSFLAEALEDPNDR
jgi:RNA polymerase sigma-70 factor (ECF subfamily)